MAKTDQRGRQRVEIKLSPEHRQVLKAKAKALKTVPPTSPKKYIEDLVVKHLNKN